MSNVTESIGKLKRSEIIALAAKEGIEITFDGKKCSLMANGHRESRLRDLSEWARIFRFADPDACAKSES